MGDFLGILKLYLQYLSAGVTFLSANPRIRAFAIFTVYLADIDSLEWTVFPGKTLQDLCQDAIFKNCYRGNLGHLFQQ